ncbi:MAG: response regulator [Gammaproteobacteria bacterium]|nr:response regulator [Gammaproteobacteria bacterium]
MPDNTLNLDQAKVLMVDDTPENLDVLRKVLMPEGYRLAFANSGERALKVATRIMPDLIMLDVMMPGMDGFETCCRLKQQQETRNIPVIFITAKTETDDLLAGFKVGAVDYITKPFRQEEVCVRVRTHLQSQMLMKQRERLIAGLSSSEKRFRVLSTWSPVGVFQTDEWGEVIYINRQWARIAGVDPEQWDGKDWLQLVHANEQDEITRRWEHSIARHAEFRAEFRMKRPADAKEIWVAAHAAPVFNEGDNDGFVGALEDISERKNAEAQAIKAKEAAESAMKAKSEFLTEMTHELCTPMNAIIGYSERLFKNSDNKQDRQDLERISSAARYLLCLINNVLQLSKVEANKMGLNPGKFDILCLLRQVESTIAPLAAKNNNRLVIEGGDTTGSMHSDAVKLQQILLNFLSNAAKFTKNGVITLRVERKTEQQKDWVYFSVTDTGIGLSETQLKKLFQKYAQADDSINIKYGGTGLGLVISREFCHLMGGDISVTSELGTGTTFTVKLPALTS